MWVPITYLLTALDQARARFGTARLPALPARPVPVPAPPAQPKRAPCCHCCHCPRRALWLWHAGWRAAGGAAGNRIRAQTGNSTLRGTSAGRPGPASASHGRAFFPPSTIPARQHWGRQVQRVPRCTVCTQWKNSGALRLHAAAPVPRPQMRSRGPRHRPSFVDAVMRSQTTRRVCPSRSVRLHRTPPSVRPALSHPLHITFAGRRLP